MLRMAYSCESARQCYQSNSSHCPHVDTITPGTHCQCFGLGSKLLHKHTVPLHCFGDSLRGYGGLVAELIVSLRDETVDLVTDQLDAVRSEVTECKTV